MPELGFAIEFPAVAQKTTIEGGHTAWMVELDNNWTSYNILTTLLTNERMQAGRDRILEDAVAGGLRRFPNATVVARGPIHLAGHEGRELTLNLVLEGKLMRMVSRVLLMQNRVYIWTAVNRETMARGEAERFLKSFALIGN